MNWLRLIEQILDRESCPATTDPVTVRPVPETGVVELPNLPHAVQSRSASNEVLAELLAELGAAFICRASSGCQRDCAHLEQMRQSTPNWSAANVPLPGTLPYVRSKGALSHWDT